MICVRNIGLPCEAVKAFGSSIDFAGATHDLLNAGGVYDLPPGYAFDEKSQTIYSARGVDQMRTQAVRQAIAIEKQTAQMQAAHDDARARIQASTAAILAASGASAGIINANLAAGAITSVQADALLAALPQAQPSPSYQPPAQSYAPQAEMATPVVQTAPLYSAPLSVLPTPQPAPLPPAPQPVTLPAVSAAAAPDPILVQQQQQAAVVLQAAQLVQQYTPYIAASRSYASQLAGAGQTAAAGQWLDYANQLEQWVYNLKTTYNVS